MHILQKTLACCIVAFFMTSCGEKTKSDSGFENKEPDSLELAEQLKKRGLPQRLDYLIDNLVLSDGMIKTLSTERNLYDNSLLNKHERAKLYTTSRSKALNLGIYGAELNYLIHFEQTQRSMRHLIASKYLATQIGVAMAFSEETMTEYESNVENTDSLINIIFMAYDNVKKVLKSEDQFLLSTLVITGSWIENMYIATKLLPYYKSKETKAKLVTKVVEQRSYLIKIKELVNALDEGDNIYVNELMVDLNRIDSVYCSFGDKLLTEDDVLTLQTHIGDLRNRIIEVE